MEAPTHKPPASHRHRPPTPRALALVWFCYRLLLFEVVDVRKLRAGGRGDGSGEWESSHVVPAAPVRQSPGSTPFGRSILTRRVWRRLQRCSARLLDTLAASARPRSPRKKRGRSSGYYEIALGGRGRANCAARESSRAEEHAAPRSRPRRARARSEHRRKELYVLPPSSLRFRFEGKRPQYAPRLREGTRSTPQRNHKDGAGARGESPWQPRAATPQHRKTSARAQPSRRGAPRRAAERRTGLVIRNLGAGWDYKLQAVLCYMRPQESQQPDAAISFPRDSRVN